MRPTIFAAALLACAVSAQAKVEAALDRVVVSGQPVELSARFEGKHDRDVEFTIGGKRAAGRTNGFGVATLRMAAKVPPGVYPYRVSLGKKTAEARVFVLDPTRPLAIVDLDGSLSLGDSELPFWGKRPDAVQGARRLLRALAAEHQVVYLSTRGSEDRRPTPEFLAEQGFPDGPILFDAWALDRKTLRQNRGVYQRLKLSQLVEQGFSLRLGIGDEPSDAAAFVGVGIPSYLFTDEHVRAPSVSFISYLQLEQRLLAEGVLRRGLAGALQ